MAIYPKLAAARALCVQEGRLFLLMPFMKELRPVHAAVKDVCSGLGMTCERADDIYSQRPIFSSILDSIISSEIVVADLTGKNPNVFYETGIAHSLREPQSVILVSQDLDDVPFDLRHLPIVLYRLDNLQRFEEEIEHRIAHCREATRGVNFATNYLYPLHFHSHDVKSFIDYANELSSTFFANLASYLRPFEAVAPIVPTKLDLERVFTTLTLAGEASNGRWRRICDFLRLEILCTDRLFPATQDLCFARLRETTITQYDISERDEDIFTTELCFRLIERDLAKARAINWLLEYLHNPRMGNIDVVRYKIETFIVEYRDSDLGASLLALLGAKAPSVRENAADLVGQKSIPNAGRFLAAALAIEDNPYAARSLITAIARQDFCDAADTIIEWVQLRVDNWWNEPISETLRRVSIETVKKLDRDGTKLKTIQSILSSGKSENKE